MNVFDTLKERGFIYQTTDETELRAMLAEPPVTAYIGYDPTADSLHTGNLIGLLVLFVQFVPSGIACGVEVTDVGDVAAKRPNDVSFHDLHMINIIKQFKMRRANLFA